MKITHGMVEAGITKLAGIRGRKLDDTSLVTSVYSAMEQQRLAEIAREQVNGSKQAAYTHQSWPAWRYGPDGEGQIFNREDDVPEGWTDSVQVHVLERDSKILSGKLKRKAA